MDLAKASVFVLAVVTCRETLAAVGICPSARALPPTFAFTLTSRRNATGHRHIKLDLGYPETTRTIKNNTDDILLEVEQRTYEAGGHKTVLITTSFVARDLRAPPAGYELAAGLGWYRLHLAPLTWEDARLACEAEGAHLAVLNSPREAAFLKGMFDRAPATIPNATPNLYAFIGFSDVIEGEYRTIFGETLEEAGYAVWDSGEPNNAKSPMDADQDCGGFARASAKLHDLPCRGKFVYFCEYAL